MPYICVYLKDFDQMIQCYADDDLIAKLITNGKGKKEICLSDTPFPNIVLTSRNRSEMKIKNGKIIG